MTADLRRVKIFLMVDDYLYITDIYRYLQSAQMNVAVTLSRRHLPAQSANYIRDFVFSG